jgi:hypothetical protein
MREVSEAWRTALYLGAGGHDELDGAEDVEISHAPLDSLAPAV